MSSEKNLARKIVKWEEILVRRIKRFVCFLLAVVWLLGILSASLFSKVCVYKAAV